MRAEAVDVIAAPDLTLTTARMMGLFVLEAIVETRPTIAVNGYADLEVEIPNPTPSDEEVQEQIDVQLRQTAELVEVERSATAATRYRST